MFEVKQNHAETTIYHKLCKFYDRIGIYILAALFVAITIIRCRFNNLWLDECLSVQFTKSPFGEIGGLDGCSPPLYYIYLKVFLKIFGRNTFAYHFASVVPYLIVVALTLTVIRKEFGTRTCSLFLILTSISPSACTYNVEIRMYALASLWLLLCYMQIYFILKTKADKNIYWMLLCIFAVAAAYTHYFAFAGVIVLYVCLLISVLWINRRKWWKFLLLTVASIALYSPWIAVFFSRVEAVSNDFWITDIPKLKEGWNFVFGSSCKWLVMLFLVGVAVSLVLGLGFIVVQKKENKVVIELNSDKKAISTLNIMIWIGFLVPVFVLIFEYAYGYLVRPVFVLRYLYPVTVLAWMSFALIFGNKRMFSGISILIGLGMIFAYSPLYFDAYIDEKNNSKETTETVEMLEAYGTNQEVIISSDIAHLSEGSLAYYFDQYQIIDNACFDWNMGNCQKILFLTNTNLEDNEEVRKRIEEQGYSYSYEGTKTIALYSFNVYLVHR